MDKIWLKHYPAGVPAEVKTDLYPSLVALLDESFRKCRTWLPPLVGCATVVRADMRGLVTSRQIYVAGLPSL